MKNPLRHHNSRHKAMGVPFEECPRCAKDKATCAKKIRLGSWQEANQWATENNESRDWEPPHITTYRCQWCDGWHMKTAKHPRTEARLFKLRDRWRATHPRTDISDEMIEQWAAEAERGYDLAQLRPRGKSTYDEVPTRPDHHKPEAEDHHGPENHR